tara:strand:- start:125 stop:307 length:183 start_codon:yes stop_codon:yes gene_type:complete
MGKIMPQDPQDRETVNVEQMALTNMYQFEALTNVLERKRQVTSQEGMDELEEVIQTKGRR